MATVDVPRLAGVMSDASTPLPKLFRVLFTLRNVDSDESVAALGKSFTAHRSALLKHEIAYCLGQMRRVSALPYLRERMLDADEEAIVRHESAEAIAAIGDVSQIEFLERFVNDRQPEVRDTVELALRRLRGEHDPANSSSSSSDGSDAEGDVPDGTEFGSVDPAPAVRSRSLERCRARLLDTSLSMYARYKAMFALRNLNTDASACALAEGLHDGNALFRHEVAFVLGQMQRPCTIAQLRATLEKADEHPMVRHEAAEALGSIATPECVEYLRSYLSDSADVVRESCVVALDMYEYETSGQFNFLEGVTTAPAEAADAAVPASTS